MCLRKSMKKVTLIKFIFAPLFILSLTGCDFLSGSVSTVSGSNSSSEEGNSSSSSSSKSSSSSSSSSEEEYTEEEINDPNPKLANSEEYNTFWNPSTAIELDIEMSSEAANFMNTYQSNHDDSTYFDYYVPCTVRLTINLNTTTYEEVGIRCKGNMSRTTFLDDGHFTLNKLSHFKLSFKQTFDDEEYDTIDQLKPFKKTWSDDKARKARKKRTLCDMEKIDIKWNRNDDETKSKESYTLKMFRDNGVIAGHSTLADTRLAINGDTPINTTYEILECIDEVFISRHFNNALSNGDLYKCTWTNLGPAEFKANNSIGVEDNTKKYHPAYDLKTNKKKSTHADLKNLMSVMNNVNSSASVFKTDIEKVMDMDEFMKYESIAYLAGNFDDFRNNSNNYYLYFTSATHIAHIIPYDFDRCLGAGVKVGDNNYKDYMTDFSPESTKMQGKGGWQQINIFWRTVCKTSDSSAPKHGEQVEAYRAQYQKNIEDLINKGTFSPTTFASYVNSFPASYRGNPDGSGSNNISFASYFNKKVTMISNYYTITL